MFNLPQRQIGFLFMNATNIKRRQIFIKKDFQGRFMMGAFAVIFLSGACSALLVYWLTGGDLQAQAQSAHVNIANASDRLGISVMLGNLTSLVIAGVVAVISALYASHKIAGPLYRFEALCKDVAIGNLNTVTKLRENDQLQALATAFADMVVQLREQRDSRMAAVAELKQNLTVLNAAATNPLNDEQKKAIASMQKLIDRLESTK